MATAYYPQGMRAKTSGGYTPWKGRELFSGSVSGHVRPFTNGDPRNNYQPKKHGLPRPMKHYRRGRVIVPSGPPDDYAIDRRVRSNTGRGLVRATMETPGGATIETTDAANCKTCAGVSVLSSYRGNSLFVNNNPPVRSVEMDPTGVLRRQEEIARTRCRPASTILNKDYYVTLDKLRVGRCDTYAQRAFNYAEKPTAGQDTAPHEYLANCTANGKSCRRVVYKPSNAQYAVQGAVDSGLRTAKLVTDTARTPANVNRLKSTTIEPVCNKRASATRRCTTIEATYGA